VKWWLAAVAVPVVVGSCGPTRSTSTSAAGGGGSCPAVSYSCPSPPPSYSATIAAIVNANCLPCHAPGGTAPDKPLGQYADLYKYRVTSLSQVVTCKMPLVGLADRQAFLDWLACGAPNN